MHDAKKPVSEIAQYLIDKGAKCSDIKSVVLDGFQTTIRFFEDRCNNVIATMYSSANAQKVNDIDMHSVIKTVNGLTKTNKTKMEMVNLISGGGKFECLFPSTITTETTFKKFGDENKTVKNSLFLIQRGVKVARPIQENGIVSLAAMSDFKTARFSITNTFKI